MVKKNSNLEFWQNSNSNWDQNEKLKLWPNSKLKLWQSKLWQNSSCDKTQIVIKVKLWQHSNYDNTLIVGEKNLKNSKCNKTQIVTKLKNWKYDKSQYGQKTNFFCLLKRSFSKNILTTDEMFSGQRFAILAMFFLEHLDLLGTQKASGPTFWANKEFKDFNYFSPSGTELVR